jgi:hypothetical protein
MTFRVLVMAEVRGTVVSRVSVVLPTAAYEASVGEVPWKPLFWRSWPWMPPSPELLMSWRGLVSCLFMSVAGTDEVVPRT